jgi:hypothetical protein
MWREMHEKEKRGCGGNETDGIKGKDKREEEKINKIK